MRMKDHQILYEDKFIQINEQGVLIRCYYFPIGTAKFVKFCDIEKVYRESDAMGNVKGWGMSLSPIW